MTNHEPPPARRPTRILVIAGSKAQANAWAYDGHLLPREWEYVTHADQIRGTQSPPAIFAFVGTWELRRDAADCELNVRLARR